MHCQADLVGRAVSLRTGFPAGPAGRRLAALCAYLCCITLAFAADPATITGRVFDVYHRPVPGASVVTIDRRHIAGKLQLVTGASAVVDKAGMYRLSVPPGSYVLAVLPPPHPLDFAAVFPTYLGDIVDADQAPSVEVAPGELRPFTDFLVLEVESHRLSGRVTGLSKRDGAAAVTLSSASGYTGPLQTTLTDPQGRFYLDHIPAGTYRLEAFSRVTAVEGVFLWGGQKSGSAQIDVRAPETTAVQIHLHHAAR